VVGSERQTDRVFLASLSPLDTQKAVRSPESTHTEQA